MSSNSRLISMLLLVACSEVSVINNRPDAQPPNGDGTRPDDTEPPVAVCGADPRVVAPGEPLDLVGGNSYDPDDIPITSYRWEIRIKPDGSAIRVSDPTVANAEVVPDVIGDYNALLIVRNDRGTESAPCSADFSVEPTERLYIEMRPSYGSDDIELRLSRDDQVCSQLGCLFDWGATNDVTDDPLFLFDDQGGAAEVIAIEDPAPGTYRITAFDGLPFSDRDNDVDVKVYVDGTLEWSGTRTFSFEGQTKSFAEIVVSANGMQVDEL